MNTRIRTVLAQCAAVWCAAALLFCLTGRGAALPDTPFLPETLPLKATPAPPSSLEKFTLPPPNPDGWQGRLSDELLDAARDGRWAIVPLLLAQGADPNVTAVHPSRPIPESDWRRRYELERLSPLGEAARQGRMDMARLLLAHGANVNIRSTREDGPLVDAVNGVHLDMARFLLAHGANPSVQTSSFRTLLEASFFSENHDVLMLMDEAEHVPLRERHVSQAPFAPGARDVVPRPLPATVGAVPMRHLLWASGHELIILQNNPKRFELCDTKSGQVTPLPNPTRRFLASSEFDADFLAVSPDGAWLVGDAGTEKRPTWLAVSVRGNNAQEWPRDTTPTKVARGWFAWMDGRRWMETGTEGEPVQVRVRTVGSGDVAGEAGYGFGFSDSEANAIVRFVRPDEAHLGVPTAFDTRPAGVAGEAVPADVYPGSFVRDATGWHAAGHAVRWFQNEQPGFLHLTVLSPDGTRIAFLTGYLRSYCMALQVAGVDGSGAQIVLERYFDGLHPELPPSCPWARQLEWTPDGTSLAFWLGANGEGGVCILPVPAATTGK